MRIYITNLCFLMTDFCLKPGTVLHSPMCNYKVVKELGHGGFGITYLVEGVVNVGCIPVTVRFALKEHFYQHYV